MSAVVHTLVAKKKYTLTLRSKEPATITRLKGMPGRRGFDGEQGVAGATWYSDVGTPDNGDGVDGDNYLNTSSGDIYKKAAGVWEPNGNIKGLSGEDGEDGTNGATWYSAAGAPDNGIGVDNDNYLNTTTGDLYKKAAGVWGANGSIKGIQGDAGINGATWRNGVGAPSSLVGVNGDYYLNDSNGDVYKKSAGVYVVFANIKGPPGDVGEDGDTGPAGATWHPVSGAPEAGLGVNGDFALDSTSSDYYQKQSGTWILIGNLKGEPGAPGATGSAGASVGTYLVNGATVSWVSGHTYRVGAAAYYLNGGLTESLEQEATADPADATFDRIDVLVLDSIGVLGLVTGTPAGSPAKPDIDPSQYLEVSFIYVAAASVVADVTEEAIYKEGVEWTVTPSTGAIVVDSLNSPRSGTKSIEGTAVGSGVYLTAVAPAPFDPSSANNLVFYINLKTSWPNKKAMRISWLEGATPRGGQIGVGNGQYGLNTNTVGSYQQIVLPMADFLIPSGADVDRLKVEIIGSGASVGFYLDDVILQGGLSTGQAQAPQFAFRGVWSAVVSYNINDVVTYRKNTLIAVQPNTNVSPVGNPFVWATLASADPVCATEAYATPFTLDFTGRDQVSVELTGALNIATITGGVNGTRYALLLKQGSGGNHGLTVTAPKARFSDDTPEEVFVLSTAEGKLDRLVIMYDSAADKYDFLAINRGFA